MNSQHKKEYDPHLSYTLLTTWSAKIKMKNLNLKWQMVNVMHLVPSRTASDTGRSTAQKGNIIKVNPISSWLVVGVLVDIKIC